METQLRWGKTKLINFGGVYSEKHSFPVWPRRWQCNAGENKDILRKHKGLLLDITFQTASNIDGCKIHTHTHTHTCIHFFVGNYQPSLCKMSPGQLQLHQQWLIIVLLKHIHQHLLMYTALFTCLWHLREPWPVFPCLFMILFYPDLKCTISKEKWDTLHSYPSFILFTHPVKNWTVCHYGIQSN